MTPSSMKKSVLPLLAFLSIPLMGRAQDFSQTPDNNSDALKAAVADAGGQVEGEPYLATDSGPDGKPAKLLVFPSPTSLVSLPATPQANFWTMTGWIRIDEQPYAKSGGPIFGILFGRNDCVLALSADRWSKFGAPSLISGSVTLLTDEEIKESGALEPGEWRRIVLRMDGGQWQLKVGDSFEKSGTVEGDTRGALKRSGTLWMRVGSFGGAATIPELSEGQ
jgi:hypothetical protein